MKEFLKDLNKAFENKVRLGIMSALIVNDAVDFTELKNLLGVTDGNLAGHLKYLEKHEFVDYEKTFVDKKPNTKYMVTKKGKAAFKKHIKAIEKLLK
ncbi:transcriptional regulator [Mangrovivirga sp. M17]|uniref:Transcriptional regulator n=1 Tax=Mangrovivirga halotolerans TaxID=2993936 RepID=A0ABT3RLE9_9BACT|nr:transcriptional regulator [Mangrovivirga halotolerans]